MSPGRFYLAATLVPALAAACFSPKLPEQLVCGEQGDCPPTLRCEASVGVCVPKDQHPVAELRYDRQLGTVEALVTAPPVTLRLVDVAGELVPVTGGKFTVDLDANPAGVELREPLTAKAENGVVTFDQLSFQRPGRRLQLTVQSGADLSAASSAFDVTVTRPAVTDVSLQSNLDGCAVVDYKLAQAQSQPVDLLVEVDPDGAEGPEGFRRATQARSEPGQAGVQGVRSSADGRPQELSWNTSVDLPELDAVAELRITPSVRGVAGAPSVAKVGIENGLRFQQFDTLPDDRPLLVGDAARAGHLGIIGMRTQLGIIYMDGGLDAIHVPTDQPVVDLALVDFDGDGLRDVAIAFPTRTVIVFQQRTPLGSWAPMRELVGLPPLAQTLGADLDHDGVDELIGVEQSSGAVVVLRGRSDSPGQWVESARPWTAGGTGRVYLADLDRDRRPDLIIGRSVPGEPVAILRGTSLGFGAPETDSGLTGNVLAVGDLDHDGRDDVASLDASGLHVAAGAGRVDIPGITGRVLAIHDMDSDARNDLIVGGEAGVLVYRHGEDRREVAFRPARVAALASSATQFFVTEGLPGRFDLYAATSAGPSLELRNVTPHRCGSRLAGALSASLPTMQTTGVGRDLNGDAKPDVVGVVYPSSSNGPAVFSMALGYGDGTFTRESVGLLEFPLANNVKDAQLFDLDGDGVTDIAVLETPRDEVSLLYNDPAHPGQFERINLITGIHPVALAVADLDHDDAQDLVLMGADQIQVRHGDPSGRRGFGEPIVVATLAGMNMDAGQCRYYCGLKMADIDDDGELDILAYSEAAQFGIRAERTSPNGFAAPIAFGVANATILAVANFMGDARKEVLLGISTSPEGQGWLQAYAFNAATSAFEPVWQYTPIAKHLGLTGAVVDLDHDGMDEILLEFDGLAVVGGKPQPGLRWFPDRTLKWPPFFYMWSADVDGDGAPELVTENAVRPIVIDLGADGQPELGRLLDARGSGSWYGEVAVGDFSGDGLLDVAQVDPDTEKVWLARQSSARVRTLDPDELAIAGAQHVALADLDGDGRPDAITPGAAQLATLGLDSQPHELQCAAESELWPLSVADINRDGRPDLITSGATQVQIFDSPAYTCSAPTSVMSLERPGAPTHHPCLVKAIDMNGDLLPDVVVVSDAVRVALQRPEAPGTFEVTDYEYVSNPPYRSYIDAAVVDIDGDHKMDVVVIGQYGELRVFYGDPMAPGHLLTSQTIDDGPHGLQSYSLALGDVNDDGLDDIVTYGDYQQWISVFQQGPARRQFQFAYAVIGALDSTYRGGLLSLVDFDADGRLDLVFPDPGQGTMLLPGR